MTDRGQRIVRVRGSRRAKLTPAEGATAEPVPADEKARRSETNTSPSEAGPNDERLRRDVPPHW